VAARGLRRLAEETAAVAAARTVERFVARRPSLDQRLEFVYSFALRDFDVSLAPMQIRSELARLVALLESEPPPRSVLEIGTARGGTLYLLASASAEDALIASIDLEGGPYGSGYARRRAKIYRAFRCRSQTVSLLRGDSHAQATVGSIQRMLRGRPIDVLLIDGDHSRDGVLADLHMYTPLVRKGGLVALHDIVPGPPENVGAVPQVWAELRALNETQEIVADREQGGYGIGLIRKAAPIGATVAFAADPARPDRGQPGVVPRS